MKSNLEELINSSKQRMDKEIIKTKLMELKNEINQLKSTYDSLESQLKSIKKDNLEKDAKLKELLLESKKIEQDFARVSENRLAQTMNLIKHDEEIFLVQEEIKKMSEMIEQKSKILNQGFLPNKDSLFLEVVKGFGVEFVEKDEKKILIKNRTKKNIESLFLEENDVEKTKEKIWELI